MIVRILFLVLFCSTAFSFEQRIIFCPPQGGSEYPTIYKTFLDEIDEAKIAMVKTKIDKPSEFGVPYFSENDSVVGNILIWTTIKKFSESQAIIWNSVYMLEANRLVERVAFITDEELEEIININKENPEKLEEAKILLFNKKREANKLEETVFYENCELTR